jgi:homoserine O-acetyltransferase/O-succinyltransferase
LRAEVLDSLERSETVIGNLREVAERLAPGRACISVVSDHGLVKTGAPWHLFLDSRKARLPSSGSFEVAAGSLARCVKFSSKRCSMAASVIGNFILLSTIIFLATTPTSGQQAGLPSTTEGDFVAKNFKFRSGETLPELRLHYTTLGKPVRNAEGRVTNAVLILHGTGGSGQQFLQQQFAGELFGPGQLLEANRYFIILPDGVGHGKSSKPSDGLHARFPQYDYDDMVAAHHLLLSEGLGVNHLRLILGTSMGCMHSFVWGETYPVFMDALMPLACQPVQIAGRNRIWRKMVMDAIRNDPEWRAGEYTAEPQQGLRTALDLLLIAGSAALYMQKTLPTRDAADKYLEDYFKARLAGLDANDLLYQVNASRNYDPSPQLEKITAHVMFINSADDFINPPELGMAEREIKKVKNARFILAPISDETRGHGTHTRAVVWKQYLAELLEKSAH